MEIFRAYHRQMVRLMLGAAVLAAVAIAAATGWTPAWAGALLLGSAASILKFAFIDLTLVQKIIAMREKAGMAQLKASGMSLALFAATAAAVIFLDWNVWALAAGIFLPRVILIADAWLRPQLRRGGAEDESEGTTDAASSASPAGEGL